MYCTHCGNKINDGDKFCTKCGAPVTNNNETKVEQVVTPDYDALPSDAIDNDLKNQAVPGVGNEKNKVCAALLAFFVGCYGVHNFYLNRYVLAIIQIILGVIWTVMNTINGSLAFAIDGYLASNTYFALNTIASFLSAASLIWAFIDFIMILASKNNYKDGKGNNIIWR